MLGVYFSGTGNTEYCVEKLTKLLDDTAKVVSIERVNAIQEIEKNEIIILGYPIFLSNMPYIMRAFINENKGAWRGKKIFCVCTMSSFSGDGAGCSARLLKKYGAEILGGIHVKMPSSICDSKFEKKSAAENQEIVRKADIKIKYNAQQIKQGKYPQEGLSLFSHFAGLFGQRLWTKKMTMEYTDKIKISDKCAGCGSCVDLCPMKNLYIQNDKAVSRGRCTMCYRCISHCPQKAIKIFGKVKNQSEKPCKK